MWAAMSTALKIVKFSVVLPDEKVVFWERESWRRYIARISGWIQGTTSQWVFDTHGLIFQASGFKAFRPSS